MPPPAFASSPSLPTEAGCHCATESPDRSEHETVFDEWHTLLLAVRTRLHDVIEAWPVLADTPEQRAAAVRSRALALDCAEALDQLHDTLIEHGHRYRRLAIDLHKARAELAKYAAHP